MSTKVDLARKTRHANRLPAPIPSVRHRPVHDRRHKPVYDRLRAVSGVDAVENELAAPTMTPGGSEPRVFGAASRSGLRADTLPPARRMSVEPLRALRRFLSLALVLVLMMVPLAIVGATALRTAAHTVALDAHNAVQVAWAAARRMSVEPLRALRRFLILTLVGVAMMAPLVIIGATALQTALHKVTPDPHSGAQASWAAAAARTEASTPEPAKLDVYVQTQASLLSGGERQFRLAVDGSSNDTSHDATVIDPSLEVDLAIHSYQSMEGSVSVIPTRLVVTRSELNWTPIWIYVAADVPCGSDLGQLQVHVRELAAQGSRGTTTVALPPVDCRPAPPALPEHR